MKKLCQAIIDKIGWKPYIIVLDVLAIAIAFGMSYGFAVWGEPRSYWLWHTILGIV